MNNDHTDAPQPPDATPGKGEKFYHAKNGLYFCILPDGGVQIEPPTKPVVLTHAEWRSVRRYLVENMILADHKALFDELGDLEACADIVRRRIGNYMRDHPQPLPITTRKTIN